MEATSATVLGEPAPVTKKVAGENGEPIWARMAGFPSWPARRCSRKEEESMTVPRAPKLKQTPVVFLGQRGEIGLIQDTSIAAFSPATNGDKFLPKKFKTDKAYRAAVVEATRIAQFQGVQFDAAFMETVQSCCEEFPLQLPTDALCVTCGGSSLSGALMECVSCSVRQRHWHCFPGVDEGAWMCDGCCQIQGLPAGSLVPFADEHHGAKTLAETGSPRTDNATTARLTTPKAKAQSSKPANRVALTAVGVSSSNTGARSACTIAGGDNSGATRRQSLIKKIYASLDSGNLPDAHSAHSATLVDFEHEGGTDDECFVCGQGGHLLLCDFPRCSRAYHQVCVLRVCPSALDSILGTSDHTIGLSTQSTAEEPWFCPCHTCVGCHALQEPPVELTVAQVPVSLLALQDRAQAAVTARRGGTASATTAATANAAIASSSGLPGDGNSRGGVDSTSTGTGTTSLCDARDSLSTPAATPAVTSAAPAPSMLQALVTRRRSSGHSSGVTTAVRNGSNGSSSDAATENQERVSSSTGLRHRALRCCASCPFSICASCEKDISGVTPDKGPLLQPRRYNDEELECLNCASKDPRMQLARILERAWLKTANSRLAVPFLHPLLPLLEDGLQNNVASGELEAEAEAGYWSELVKSGSTSGSCSSGSLAALQSSVIAASPGSKRSRSAMDAEVEGSASQKRRSRQSPTEEVAPSAAGATNHAHQEDSNAEPGAALLKDAQLDLLAVLDRIHALRYASIEEYCTDLLKIRSAVEQKILRHSASAALHAAQGGGTLQHSLLMAWDTIVEAGDALLVSKAGQIATLQQKIRDDPSVQSKDKSRTGPLARKQPNCSVATVMQSLWRAETFCTAFVRVSQGCGMAAGDSSRAEPHHGGLAPRVIVPARSVAGWTAYVENGAVPEEFRGPQSRDPYSVKEVVARAEHRARAPDRARDAVRAMLGKTVSGLEGHDGAVDVAADTESHTAEEWQAAELMFGMQHTALREDVTLLEGAGDLVAESSRFPSYFQRSNGGCAPGVPDLLQADDSLVILDRLREVTQTALQLEERLKRELVAKQRRLFETDTETVTLGQASIIAELKLANDNLRWRLQQKQDTIDAQQAVIAELRRQLEESRKGANGAAGGEGKAGVVENGVAVRTVSK